MVGVPHAVTIGPIMRRACDRPAAASRKARQKRRAKENVHGLAAAG
jgi:hypothetical protein